MNLESRIIDIAEHTQKMLNESIENYNKLYKTIQNLIKKYPNDIDLGKVIRNVFTDKN